MYSYKYAHFILWSFLIVLSSVVNATEYDSEDAQEDHHENHPRFLSFWSKPKLNTEKHVKVGFKQHISNVLNGGTFGIQAEFGPFVKLHGVFDHAKKFFPFVGHHNGGGWHNLPPPHKSLPPVIPEDDGPFGWEPKEPKVPEKPKEKPNWDDIDEGGDDEPVEYLIDPRRRPKRYIDSKVYHVPVEFLSNAKPVGVEIQNGNKNSV